MAKAANKKKPNKAMSNGDALSLAVGAAAASIMGNIAQAFDRAEAKRQGKHLMSVLEQWQSAYNRLRMDYERQKEILDQKNQENDDLRREVAQLRASNFSLKKELSELSKESKKR